jgi:hypothetical protein
MEGSIEKKKERGYQHYAQVEILSNQPFDIFGLWYGMRRGGARRYKFQ